MMATDTSSKFQIAFPFDNSSGAHADMILRSADGVDFSVMKGILALASPIFHDMTALAKPLAAEGKGSSADVSEDGLPVVIMYESNAVVLDALLRILYPVVTPKLDDLGLISDLLRAAQKYDMNAVLHVLEDALRELAMANKGEHSMEVYILAWEYRLEDILRIAISEFLKNPEPPTYFSGLKDVPASALFQLFEYRRTVADKVDALFASFQSCNFPPMLRSITRDIECSTKNMKPAKGCGTFERGFAVSAWWVTLRDLARAEIHKAPLSDGVINAALVSQAAFSPNCCTDCKEKVFRQLFVLEATIKQSMRELAAEVKFDIRR